VAGECPDMIRVLIVDDEGPARAKLRRWLAADAALSVVGESADGAAALAAIETLQPDLVFLDIQLPGISGLQVAAQLEASRAPLIVFATAFDAHAIDAFELGAIDYLLKPYDEARLQRTLARVQTHIDRPEARIAPVAHARQRQPCDRLLVPDGEGFVLIDVATIRWLEADDNHVRVHCGSRAHLLRRTMRDLVEQLGEARFVRIHKSVAVNVAEVAGLQPLFKGDYSLRLRDGTELRLSRRYREALLAFGAAPNRESGPD